MKAENMEFVTLPGLDKPVSRICYGTWAIGGWMWGHSSDADEGFKTILQAYDMGINFLDTAPCYGLGASEQLVGRAIREIGRENVVLATKFGLQWDEKGDITRNCTAQRMRKEIEDSLLRLNVDYVDLYNVHWPDPLVPFEETAALMEDLKKEGKIRAIGVSNFDPAQMKQFAKGGTINSSQIQYNIFERGIEDDVLPYQRENHIFTVLYSTLCRGMLGGRMKVDTKFSGDDMRLRDPKWQMPRYAQYVSAVDQIDAYAKQHFGHSVNQLSTRWVLDQPGCDVVIWGAKNRQQLEAIPGMLGWKMTAEDIAAVNKIVDDTVTDPATPEYLLPPDRNGNTHC